MGAPAGARARRARYNSRIKRCKAAAGGSRQKVPAIGGSPRYRDATTYRTYRKAKGASMPRDDRRSNYSSSRGSGNRRSDGGRGYGDRGYGNGSRDRGDRRGYGSRTRDDRGYSDSRGYGDRDRSRDDRNHGSRGYRDRDDRRERRDGRGYRDEERPSRDRREQYGDFDRRDQRRERSYDGFDDYDGYEAYDDAYEEFGYDGETFDDARPEDPNERRVEVRCPVAKRCGGCEWLAMPYDEQLDRKQDYIEELFSNYKCEPDPILGMNDPWHFRNKIQLPFAPGRPGRDGRTTARWGIFERGSHNIVPCTECLVEDGRARPIIATIASLLPRFNIQPYDEKTGEGLLRYALVRTAYVTDQVMLTLVCNGTRIPSSQVFIDRLLEAHPEITTIVLNVNRERTSVILGSEEKVLYGPGYIEDELCGCRFRISSSSFYQTNPVAAEALYELAVELADIKPSDRIGDAYCGTGTIGIVAAKQSGAQLLGVERNGEAVDDARENARINGIENAEFVVGDAGSVFARMARAGEELDVVFMDPPRSGSSQAFLANLSRLGPTRVVYISCEPRTQHHDIAALVKNGYRVKRICPVDMFPHTDHVENIVLLERPRRKTLGHRNAYKDKVARGGSRELEGSGEFEEFDEGFDDEQ